MSKLPLISKEQQQIIHYLQKGNVIVDAVAGSGKTTTNLYVAKQLRSQNILLLTYNARLKDETRNKVKINGLTNLEVHSYHSFCVKHYYDKSFTDTEIKNVIRNKYKQKRTFSDSIITD